MLTLDDEYSRADDVSDLLTSVTKRLPKAAASRFLEWCEIDVAIDTALTKARALRDKIAAMKE